MRKLQDILDDIPFEALAPAWTTFDLARLLSCQAAVGVPAALHAQASVIAESKSIVRAGLCACPVKGYPGRPL
jgi:hypothetical protein